MSLLDLTRRDWPEPLSAETCRAEYPVLWQKAAGLLPDLSEGDLARVVSLAAGVCGACRENGAGCQCWNDE